MPNNRLAQLREQIDQIDRDILALIDQRIALSEAIDAAKQGTTRYCPERESEVMGRLLTARYHQASLFAIWRLLINDSLSSQGGLHVLVAGAEPILALAKAWFGLGATYYHEPIDQLRQKSGDCLVAALDIAVTLCPPWVTQMILPFDPNQSQQKPQALVMTPSRSANNTAAMQPLWLGNGQLTTGETGDRQLGFVPTWLQLENRTS